MSYVEWGGCGVILKLAHFLRVLKKTLTNVSAFACTRGDTWVLKAKTTEQKAPLIRIKQNHQATTAADYKTERRRPWRLLHARVTPCRLVGVFRHLERRCCTECSSECRYIFIRLLDFKSDNDVIYNTHSIPLILNKIHSKTSCSFRDITYGPAEDRRYAIHTLLLCVF